MQNDAKPGFTDAISGQPQQIMQESPVQKIPFQVTVDKRPECWHIQLQGDLGKESASELKALLLEGIHSGKDLSLDLSQVSQIDVSSMRLILAADREASLQPNGIVRLVPKSTGADAINVTFEKFPVLFLPN